MKIHYYPELPVFNKPVVTVGTFDGVHLGHREVIRNMKNIARQSGGETIIITLWPHPRIVLGKTDPDFSLLNSIEEKTSLLSNAGIDHLIIIPFTLAFSQNSSGDFIKNILVDKIHVNDLLVGANNHYGRNREGDSQSISDYAKKFGFRVHVPPMINDANEKVSSSVIRALLKEGNIRKANRFLTIPYAITGKVVEGDKIGQTIGYPTANLSIDNEFKLIPPDGVYAVKVKVSDNEHQGMMYIGFRPTVKKNAPKKNIEVHLFNFADNLYSKTITVLLIDRVRGEMTFDSLEALTRQITLDQEKVINILNTKL